MTIATIKKEIKDLKNALNTNLDEKFKVKLREQLSKSEKTLAEMESAKTPTAKKTATKKANVVAKKSTSVLQKVKQANKKAEPKKSTPAKKSTAKQPSALQKIKNQVKLNKNLSGYKNSGIDLVRDGNRPALPLGKRISKDGNTYYEYRLNHVDLRQPSKKVKKPNKLEEGGMMADGGEFRGGIRYPKGKELEWYDLMGFDVVDYGEKEAERKAYDYIQDSIKYWNGELNEEDFKVRRIGGGKDYKGRAFDSWVVMRQRPKYADGGMMAKGGVMKPLTYYVYETPKITISWRGKTQPYGRFKSAEDALIFIKNISQTNAELSEYSIVTPDAILKVSDYMDDGGMMANGGRLKSALMRDRAYKSNEPYEQAYKRKTRPKNPKYNFGFFEDGGSTEMHRAYAMGGVLQHGLESGDFIVSHDEGKMIIMNGGNKYEVNIHSGSRTKID